MEFVEKKTEVAYFRNRYEDFMSYFIKNGDLVLYNDDTEDIQEVHFS